MVHELERLDLRARMVRGLERRALHQPDEWRRWQAMHDNLSLFFTELNKLTNEGDLYAGTDGSGTGTD